MAGSGDSKSISFKFDIDETSFANAKLKIIDLTKLLTDLAKVAGGISMPTGAGGAGGNFLSGYTGWCFPRRCTYLPTYAL